jgi:Na+-driven multidrug efflux pump
MEEAATSTRRRAEGFLKALSRCRAPMKQMIRAEIPSAFVAVRMHLMIVLVVASVGLIRTSALARDGIAAQVDCARIPLIFGLGTRVLTMAGTNAGAENFDHLTRLAWTRALAGGVSVEVFGVLAAIFPTLWTGSSSADPDAVENI